MHPRTTSTLVAVLMLSLTLPGPAEAGQQRRPLATSGTCSEITVYFTFGQDRLDQSAMETIDAQFNALAGGPIHVEVVGHIDMAEAAAGDPSLADRRVAAVQAAFQRWSARAAFTFQMSSEDASNPAVPTGPRIREPLNRRAEIRACRV